MITAMFILSLSILVLAVGAAVTDNKAIENIIQWQAAFINIALITLVITYFFMVRC